MPELPEVETTLRDLRAGGAAGAVISKAEVLRARTVEPLDPTSFAARVEGAKITALRRRGKFLLFFLDNGGLLAAHLRMSGSFAFFSPDTPRDMHDRLVLTLATETTGKELRFHDPRAFGRVRFLLDESEATAALGPEPLDPALSDEAFFQLLQRKRRIKALLLDQRVLAGLGNIYADEALHAAGLHPLSRADQLERDQAARLLAAVRGILQGAIDQRGTSLGEGEGNYRSAGQPGENLNRLAVYGRTGEPCPVCGTAIERLIAGGRGTHICPRCQPLTGNLTPRHTA